MDEYINISIVYPYPFNFSPSETIAEKRKKNTKIFKIYVVQSADTFLLCIYLHVCYV